MKLKSLLVLFVTLTLAACGDSDNKDKKDKNKETTAEEKKTPVVAKTENKKNTKEEYKMAQTKFLEDYATKDGVQKTDSGLLYTIANSGDAAGKSPVATDEVTVHYAGRLIDGTEFDSSYKRGETIEFPLNRVIPGWTEILQLMKPGDKWEVVIPSDLGYGDQESGPIPAGSTLVFDIELFSFVSAADKEKIEAEKQAVFTAAQTVFLTENAKKDGVTVSESGLQYTISTANKDGKSVQVGDMVLGHLQMKLTDGTIVSDSRQGGQPIEYPVDEVFPGWSEAVKLMKVGETIECVIPASLAFGPEGYAQARIPGGATILLELTVESVRTKADLEAEIAAFAASQATFITDYTKEHADAVTTDSGLVYRVIKMGEGAKPTADQTVNVHYAGRLTDGTEFDSSYKRNSPVEFGVTQVIQGWIEGLQLMPVGSKFEFVIKSDLGYGQQGSGSGSIPPGATLVFEVELLGVK